MDIIKNDTLITDIIRKHPECLSVFEKYNLTCISCMGAENETIFEGAVMHSICPISIVSELNKCIRDNKAE